MIVLFGSYARDEWVEDTHLEGHITHVYESDFDILVATKSKKVAEDFKVHDTVEQNINATGKVNTPYGIIYHSFSYVKQMITEGHYFFTDIQKEGIYLFRTHKHKIGAIKTIPPQERKTIAREHFNQWFESAKVFYKHFEYSLRDGDYKNAAFNLHQATERFYGAVTLVFINYRFRTHDIQRLGTKAVSYNGEFAKVFPRETDEQRKLFNLLRKAYVDARYKDSYEITKEQLEQLALCVQKLHEVTKKICQQKIESFV